MFGQMNNHIMDRRQMVEQVSNHAIDRKWHDETAGYSGRVGAKRWLDEARRMLRHTSSHKNNSSAEKMYISCLLLFLKGILKGGSLAKELQRLQRPSLNEAFNKVPLLKGASLMAD